ncbi:MAG: TetR/AcrR family transcriptional regulator [Gemmatimonadetes bacterium]|nr:TetR/AcrR family transcriptional regulator [Gemmatimonadota bacterium]
MGSRERRDRERADTRQRILDAARDMFVRHGYDDTTMRAIAERIEYTATAIYHHFESKEALLSELCAADFRALAAAFQRIGRVEDPIERVLRLGEAYVSFAIDHPMHYQLMFMTRRPTPTKQGIVRGDPGQDAYAFLRETCADAIASGRLRPELRDPDEVAQMLWATLHGLVALHIIKQDDPWVDWREIRSTARHMCEAMKRGLEATPERGTAASADRRKRARKGTKPRKAARAGQQTRTATKAKQPAGAAAPARPEPRRRTRTGRD